MANPWPLPEIHKVYDVPSSAPRAALAHRNGEDERPERGAKQEIKKLKQSGTCGAEKEEGVTYLQVERSMEDVWMRDQSRVCELLEACVLCPLGCPSHTRGCGEAWCSSPEREAGARASEFQAVQSGKSSL